MKRNIVGLLALGLGLCYAGCHTTTQAVVCWTTALWRWMVGPPRSAPSVLELQRVLFAMQATAQPWPTGRSVRPVRDQRPLIEYFRLPRNDFAY